MPLKRELSCRIEAIPAVFPDDKGEAVTKPWDTPERSMTGDVPDKPTGLDRFEDVVNVHENKTEEKCYSYCSCLKKQKQFILPVCCW